MPESTFALLRKDGSLKFCSANAHFRWIHLGPGRHTSKLKYSLIGLYSIETIFSGESRSIDGPHLWWTTTTTKHASLSDRKWKDPSGGFWTALHAALTSRLKSLEDILNAQPDSVYAASFATKEAALKAHVEAVKFLRAHMRLVDVRCEPSQQLLAQLSYWCKQGWGRQTKIARMVAVSPQRINDWLGGRKKITADCALLIQKFLDTENRRKR